MASRHMQMIIYLRVRWWVHPYLMTLGFVASVLGCAPDVEKAGKFIAKYGVTYRIGCDG